MNTNLPAYKRRVTLVTKLHTHDKETEPRTTCHILPPPPIKLLHIPYNCRCPCLCVLHILYFTFHNNSNKINKFLDIIQGPVFLFKTRCFGEWNLECNAYNYSDSLSFLTRVLRKWIHVTTQFCNDMLYIYIYIYIYVYTHIVDRVQIETCSVNYFIQYISVCDETYYLSSFLLTTHFGRTRSSISVSNSPKLLHCIVWQTSHTTYECDIS
jgi:hypothetical protein